MIVKKTLVTHPDMVSKILLLSRKQMSLCFSILFVYFSEYFYDQDDRSDEEGEPTFSEDEAVTQKGLRRSQSVKISRSRVRKDVNSPLHTL